MTNIFSYCNNCSARGFVGLWREKGEEAFIRIAAGDARGGMWLYLVDAQCLTERQAHVTQRQIFEPCERFPHRDVMLLTCLDAAGGSVALLVPGSWHTVLIAPFVEMSLEAVQRRAKPVLRRYAKHGKWTTVDANPVINVTGEDYVQIFRFDFSVEYRSHYLSLM